MNISIICVGKLKEKYFKDAVSEYLKRLTRYCKLNIIEIQDEKTPENASPKEEMHIKQREGEGILKNIKDEMFVIALDIEGSMFDSKELSKYIENLSINGESNIAFVIGGSLGLSREVLSRANFRLSFSNLTFPHQLFRIMLLEQIYRSFKIMKGEPYHK